MKIQEVQGKLENLRICANGAYEDFIAGSITEDEYKQIVEFRLGEVVAVLA